MSDRFIKCNTITSCFSAHFNGASVDRFIKWNTNNHSCAIFNGDGRCLGFSVRAGFGRVIENK